MGLLPDSGWLHAFNLPTKVIGGFFLTTIVILGLDLYSLLNLAAFGILAHPIVVVLSILLGCLLLASLVNLVAQPTIEKRKASLISYRRVIRKEEERLETAKRQAKAILTLDHLSGWELQIVAEALRDESPSLYDDVHSSPISQLVSKGLVYSPGGNHHQDHYPFTFEDFVWTILIEQKDNFIHKAEEAKKREDDKNRGRYRR